MMALATRFSRLGCFLHVARDEVGRHSVLFDANGAMLRRQEIAARLLCNRQRPCNAHGSKDSARTLVRSAGVPVGILEMNPAIPKSALRAATLSGSFTSHLSVRSSLAEPFLRFFLTFGQVDLHRTGSPELREVMVAHAGDAFTSLFGASCGSFG